MLSGVQYATTKHICIYHSATESAHGFVEVTETVANHMPDFYKHKERNSTLNCPGRNVRNR